MGLDPVTIMAGSSLVSGLLGADAASNAADMSAAASDRATAAQRDMFNTTLANLAPFKNMGTSAGTKLSQLLGIGGSPGGAPGLTYEQARAQLLPQFTTAGQSDVGAYANDPMAAAALRAQGIDPATWSQSAATGSSTVDEAGLQAAINKLMASQPAGGVDSSAPDYGSLIKPFGMEDFQLDPGTQFQMQQGNMALTNSQAAKDGVLTGAALKDLIAYNQGMAGTGYQSAFDRYMSGKGFTLSSLMGLTNLGQASAANQATGGSSYASGISNTIQGAGQAQAAGAIGGANALGGAATNAANLYYLSSLLGKNGGAKMPGTLDSTAGQLINPVA